MDFQKLREFFLALLADVLNRLKPERVQGRTVSSETPMTVERIHNRAEESGFEVIYAPVAIRKRFNRGSFAKAMASACETVAPVAAELGHAPKTVVDGGFLTVTLGIEIPNLLSEADFDVADALNAALDDAEPDDEAGQEPAPRSG